MLGTLAKVFCEFAIFVFAKVGYYESLSLYTWQSDSLLRATSFCHPGVRQENGSARLLFPSYRRWGFGTAKYHGLEAHPCTCRWYCLTLLSEVSRNKLQMQQPSFQKWGFARAKHQGPLVFAFPLMRPLLMARVCGYAKEWAKVKVHFEGSGPVSLAKKS